MYYYYYRYRPKQDDPYYTRRHKRHTAPLDKIEGVSTCKYHIRIYLIKGESILIYYYKPGTGYAGLQYEGVLLPRHHSWYIPNIVPILGDRLCKYHVYKVKEV